MYVKVKCIGKIIWKLMADPGEGGASMLLRGACPSPSPGATWHKTLKFQKKFTMSSLRLMTYCEKLVMKLLGNLPFLSSTTQNGAQQSQISTLVGT